MVRLVPMMGSAFEAFMKISMRDHAQGQIKAGSWRVEAAEGNIEKLRNQFLPDGLTTANHFFFTIEDASTGDQVGGLWYMVTEIEGKQQFFVVDIQIDEVYRRRGVGTQAFLVMEEQARTMGIGTISLHVFKHNTSARAMYEKLGYVGADEVMSKTIRAEAN